MHNFAVVEISLGDELATERDRQESAVAITMQQAAYDVDVVRRIALPGMVLDVSDFRFDSATEMAFVDDHHSFGLCLSEAPRNSRSRFVGADMDYTPTGQIAFQPAGRTLLARNDGGRQTILRCRISQKRFDAVSGRKLNWEAQQLTQSVNLSATPIRQLLEGLSAELAQPGFASRSYVDGMASLLIVNLLRSLGFGQDNSYDQGGLTPYQIARLDARLDDAQWPIPTVGELATLLGLSERHLSRAFRQSFGTTLRDRLQDVSCARACEWLTTTDMPMKMIAARLGFTTQGSFTTAFGRATGETPTAFRLRSRH
ncbi:AraC family transcriptional regulator [Sphingomonas montanisoli]|uniref:Helix-turn-helix transcriptional regulator n=1 Tax=Sphingomonas montanisoli TaxID=2606412 RepID=A0A5D9CD43_9SPHN|nr:AraC family transcriptional regulator [Sphingomonas montanisoli]TZG29579.1 helix-turn-helix transcriptional regulator [Sphingomonas montanisoli]